MVYDDVKPPAKDGLQHPAPMRTIKRFTGIGYYDRTVGEEIAKLCGHSRQLFIFSRWDSVDTI